jgi:hypothetical protein
MELPILWKLRGTGCAGWKNRSRGGNAGKEYYDLLFWGRGFDDFVCYDGIGARTAGRSIGGEFICDSNGSERPAGESFWFAHGVMRFNPHSTRFSGVTDQVLPVVWTPRIERKAS